MVIKFPNLGNDRFHRENRTSRKISAYSRSYASCSRDARAYSSSDAMLSSSHSRGVYYKTLERVEMSCSWVYSRRGARSVVDARCGVAPHARAKPLAACVDGGVPSLHRRRLASGPTSGARGPAGRQRRSGRTWRSRAWPSAPRAGWAACAPRAAHDARSTANVPRRTCAAHVAKCASRMA